MKVNYHTHIYRCGHASGDVEDYVLEGIKKGYKIIGISDHGPLPDYLFDRMSMEEKGDYLRSILLAKAKYRGEIDIFAGLELEYFEEFNDYYEKLKIKFDYLVLGAHYFHRDGRRNSSWEVKNKEDLLAFEHDILKAMDSGYFDFVAHPDIFATSYINWDERAVEVSQKICEKALELDIPLELNANGIRRDLKDTPQGKRYSYPRKEFWKLASQMGVKVLVNSDCHHVSELDDKSMKKARELAKEWNLKVVDFYR